MTPPPVHPLDLDAIQADFDDAVAHIATTDRHIIRAIGIGAEALAEVRRLLFAAVLDPDDPPPPDATEDLDPDELEAGRG